MSAWPTDEDSLILRVDRLRTECRAALAIDEAERGSGARPEASHATVGRAEARPGVTS
jgi:hypothetical protein